MAQTTWRPASTATGAVSLRGMASIETTRRVFDHPRSTGCRVRKRLLEPCSVG